MVTTSTIEDQKLVDLGLRLIAEYIDVPAGSVLRCLARAVVNARSWGCPSEHLVTTAEASTRWLLARRVDPTTARTARRRPAFASRRRHLRAAAPTLTSWATRSGR